MPASSNVLTPDDVLTTIGNALVRAGYIQTFTLQDATTNRKGAVPIFKNLVVTHNNAAGTKLIIKGSHDREQQVLVLTELTCPRLLVDLITPRRNIELLEGSPLPVGVAVRKLLDHFRTRLGCKSA
jgi:hypothetical protein